MPIYEYRCQKCRQQFELLVFDRDAAVQCPDCGSKQVNKLPSLFAHKSDQGFTPSSGGSACGSCSASSCTGCGNH